VKAWLTVCGQYSQAVRAGNYVYTSGSVGMTKEGQMVEGTVGDRTRQVLQVSL
jgi:enamine deaminase RidA (YjgF/YER057c/UK114 family)